jgi:hypothetical protein
MRALVNAGGKLLGAIKDPVLDQLICYRLIKKNCASWVSQLSDYKRFGYLR